MVNNTQALDSALAGELRHCAVALVQRSGVPMWIVPIPCLKEVQKASAHNLIVNGTKVDTAFPIAPLD